MCRSLPVIAVHCLHRSLSSQFLAVWVLLRLLVGQPQHWSLLACSCRSMASTGRWSCEAGVKTAASSCNCLELLGGWLLPGRRSEGNPSPILSQHIKICQQDHLFPCKNLYFGSVFFFFLPVLCSSLAEGAPQPSSFTGVQLDQQRPSGFTARAVTESSWF